MELQQARTAVVIALEKVLKKKETRKKQYLASPHRGGGAQPQALLSGQRGVCLLRAERCGHRKDGRDGAV